MRLRHVVPVHHPMGEAGGFTGSTNKILSDSLKPIEYIDKGTISNPVNEC